MINKINSFIDRTEKIKELQKENKNLKKSVLSYMEKLEKLQKYKLYAQMDMKLFHIDNKKLITDVTNHPVVPHLPKIYKITLEKKDYQKLLIKEKFYNDVVYGTILK